MPLHINIQDLIAGRTVESDRIEYKKGWNPGSIYRSICAFEGAIEGAIEGVTKRVKEKLTAVLSVIAANEGKRTPEYAQITGINAKSLERYITTLRNAELIFFSQKATQIGGYYLTDELRSKLSNANN